MVAGHHRCLRKPGLQRWLPHVRQQHGAHALRCQRHPRQVPPRLLGTSPMPDAPTIKRRLLSGRSNGATVSERTPPPRKWSQSSEERWGAALSMEAVCKIRRPLVPDVMGLSGGLARGLRWDPSASHPAYPWGLGRWCRAGGSLHRGGTAAAMACLSGSIRSRRDPPQAAPGGCSGRGSERGDARHQ